MGNKTSRGEKVILDEKDISLLLENTNFTREQILEWHKGFLVSQFILKIIYLKPFA